MKRGLSGSNSRNTQSRWTVEESEQGWKRLFLMKKGKNYGDQLIRSLDSLQTTESEIVKLQYHDSVKLNEIGLPIVCSLDLIEGVIQELKIFLHSVVLLHRNGPFEATFPVHQEGTIAIETVQATNLRHCAMPIQKIVQIAHCGLLRHHPILEGLLLFVFLHLDASVGDLFVNAEAGCNLFPPLGSIASIALIDAFEGVDVLDEFSQVVLLLLSGSLFVVVEHQKVVFEEDGDLFLFVAIAFLFFVRFFSEIYEAVYEAYFDIFELFSVVVENEAVQQPHRPSHARIKHVFDTIFGSSGDEFGYESPSISVLGVEFDEIVFLLGSPLLLVDASLEVVVVALAALFAIAALNLVFPLHDPRNLAPPLNFPHLVDLLQNLVFLSLNQAVPMLSRSFFRTSLVLLLGLLINYNP